MAHKFQYISCCSLSIGKAVPSDRVVSFQYISCCSLSTCQVYTQSKWLEFQYISCCSLSSTSSPHTSFAFISIHLMLQFIWLSICPKDLIPHFNTSHVVVYLFNQFPCSFHNVISIHLMLQFILALAVLEAQKTIFQYISCCSLSEIKHMVTILEQIFQYISCCSLSRKLWNEKLWKERFQYISCCSLSMLRSTVMLGSTDFNTSHVVVYR